MTAIALFGAGQRNSRSWTGGLPPVASIVNNSTLGRLSNLQNSGATLLNTFNHRGGLTGILSVDFTATYTIVPNIGNPFVDWRIDLEYSPDGSTWFNLFGQVGNSFSSGVTNVVIDFTNVLMDGRHLFWRFRTEVGATLDNLADSADCSLTVNSTGNFIFVS